jgi:peptide/nickel transport system substrate-binding protein
MSKSRHLLFVLALLVAVGPATAGTPRSVFVMAKALDDLVSLDPAEVFEFSGAEVIANLYQRLFRANPDDPGSPIGEVVESWQVSDDGRTFTFTLRDGLTFPGGRLIEAADAVFSLRRVVVLNKAPSFILTQLGLTAEGIEAQIRTLDARRFTLTLDRPYAPSLVLNVLTAGIASVVDRVAAMEQDPDWLRSHAAGSGPFTLKRWEPGEYLLLDANPDYVGGRPALKRVVLRDIREPSTQRLLIETGDIDAARNLGPDQIAALAGDEDIRVLTVPRARLFYMALNQRHPQLGRAEVRRALRQLVDYEAIAATLLAGRASAHQAFLPKGFFAALEERPFAYRPEQARALLVEAGLADGFSVAMDVRSDPVMMLVAQAIQASMAEAGVAIEILPGTGKQVLTRYRARRHDIFIGQWGPDYLDPHTNASTFARNPDNGDDARERTLAWRNGWEIPELTALAEQAVLEQDSARRAEIYVALQRRVQEDSPFIVLFQENELIALAAGVQGFSAGLTSDQTLYHGIRK